MPRRITIGDLGVCRGRPEQDNPHHRTIMGNERVAAIAAFKHQCETLPSVLHNPRNPQWAEATYKGRPRSDYTFWHMPYTGPYREVTDPSEVDWESSSVDSYIFDLPNYLEHSR